MKHFLLGFIMTLALAAALSFAYMHVVEPTQTTEHQIVAVGGGKGMDASGKSPICACDDWNYIT